MRPRIQSGDLVIVDPLNGYLPVKGDVVLCTVAGSSYLHLVGAVRGDSYQITNARGHVNGWVGIGKIHGILVAVEP